MGFPRDPKKRALQRKGLAALDLAIVFAGGASKLAGLIGTSGSSISHWQFRDERVPLDYVPAICAAINHPKITPYTLRPDLAAEWRRITPLLVACDEGRGRTTPLDRFEVDNERKKPGMPTLKRIATQLAQQSVA